MPSSASASTPQLANRSVPAWFIWLAVLFAAIWLATLGTRKLMNPDEGRYAEIPREMAVSGDWLTPHLNDLKYFEKPPLQYWATAVAYEIFGISEFTSRLWCGLTGLATVFFTGWAGIRLFGRDAGLTAAALLGCSLMQVLTAQVNTLDSGVSFFMVGAIFSFLLAQREPFASKQERNWMVTAWIMAALGLLSKGLEAVVLPGLVLVVYSLVEREWSSWKRLHIVIGLPIFAIIAAPWFIAVSIVNPEFAHFFFIHEHFERFLTDVHERVEPWWWFLLWLPVGALPWFSITIHGALQQWRLDAGTNVADGFRPRRFLIVWAVVIVLFFSASHSKLIPYILPVVPALALLAGDIVTRMQPSSLQRHLMGTGLIWLAAIAYLIFGPLPESHNASQALMRQVFNWGTGAFALMLGGSLCAIYFVGKQRRLFSAAILSLGTFFGLCILLMGVDTAREVTSGYDLARAIKPHHDANKPFYSLNDYDQTLPLYLGRPITLVGYRGELDFGLTQEPRKGMPDLAAFAKAWSDDPIGSIAVMPNATYRLLEDQHAPMKVIGHSVDVIAVIKP